MSYGSRDGGGGPGGKGGAKKRSKTTVRSKRKDPIFVDGKCVGSVAASGGNGEQDIAVCEAGIAAFMRHLGR